MDKCRTFQLGHSYALDGDPDDVRTVVTRCVDHDGPGASYVILADRNGALSIHPVELDGDGEALLAAPGDVSDLEEWDYEDGEPLPYWIPVTECPDVTE